MAANPGSRCTYVLADTTKKQAFSCNFSTVFDPPRSYTSGTLQSRSIFGRRFILPMHCRDNQVESLEDSQSRRQHSPNMAMGRVHMKPFSLRLRALQCSEIP
jgi:hypothetical protein